MLESLGVAGLRVPGADGESATLRLYRYHCLQEGSYECPVSVEPGTGNLQWKSRLFRFTYGLKAALFLSQLFLFNVQHLCCQFFHSPGHGAQLFRECALTAVTAHERS